jgi:putative SOS response-associated peptidase YedK
VCGRTAETADEEELQAYLDSLEVSWERAPKYGKRWNIAPSTDQITIVEDATGRVARSMRWGWYRHWSDRLISNATREKVATAKIFIAAFRSTRALVVVDSYYEWRKNPSGPDTPFRIYIRGGGLFTMAALWEPGGPSNDGITSCTILTAPATAEMRPIHKRMPVILADDAALEWINPDTSPAQLEEIIDNRVCDLEMYATTTYVNSSRHEGPECWGRAAA